MARRGGPCATWAMSSLAKIRKAEARDGQARLQRARRTSPNQSPAIAGASGGDQLWLVTNKKEEKKREKRKIS